MMRFAIPVNDASEVAALSRAGAGELYCGLLEDSWAAKYGDHDSISRRQGLGNFQTRDALHAAVMQAADEGIPVSLALNARYTEPQLDYLEDLCLWFEDIGGASIIASDVGLLARLSGKTQLPRTLSILAVAENEGTIRAFASLGISRVVLPRFATPALAQELLTACPDIEAEVMAFFDKCYWVDGYCRHFHGVGYRDWPENLPFEGALYSLCTEEDLPVIKTICTNFRGHACQLSGLANVNPYACGACHLGAFEQAGVSCAKIGGRGLPLEERLRALRFLREVAAMEDDADRQAAYRRAFQSECNCYYGEAGQARERIEDPGIMSSERGRRIVGSQVSFAQCMQSIGDWQAEREGAALCSDEPVSVMLPPLSQEQYLSLDKLIGRIEHVFPQGARLCVNDVGTYVRAVDLAGIDGLIQVAVGTLLARVDDSREIQALTRSEVNPSRTVCGPDGKAYRLEHKEPSPDLIAHWKTPSLLEPTAFAALAGMCAN